MSVNIRTTFDPDEIITVSDAEYYDLLRQGLVYAVEGGAPIPPKVFTDAQTASLNDTYVTPATVAAEYAPLAGKAVASSSVYVQRYPKAKATAIARFHAGLGGRFTAGCDIVNIGDSITEGEGATARDFRYASTFRNRLRAAFPTPGVIGGDNYQTAMPTISTYPKDPDANLFNQTGYGLGRRGKQLAAGSPLTFTVNASSVKMAWLRDTGTGTFSYSIDGAAAVNVNTIGAHADGQTTAYTFATPGAHTVTISLVSGFVNFEGLYVYNGDEARGIRVWESGHFNWKTSDFLAAASGGSSTDWLAHLTNIQPHLVTIALGANDATAISAAAYKTNMLALIAAVRAAVTVAPSIVLVAYAARNNTLIEPWANYVQALKEIATADTAIDVLDMTTIMPAANGAPAGWYLDTVHPANKGHSEIARALSEFVTP